MQETFIYLLGEYYPKMSRHHHGVVVYVLDCNIIVSKFELQSRYYIHFWTNTLGKGMS